VIPLLNIIKGGTIKEIKITDIQEVNLTPEYITVMVKNTNEEYSPDRKGDWFEHIWPNSFILINGEVGRVDIVDLSIGCLEIKARRLEVGEYDGSAEKT